MTATAGAETRLKPGPHLGPTLGLPVFRWPGVQALRPSCAVLPGVVAGSRIKGRASGIEPMRAVMWDAGVRHSLSHSPLVLA